MEIITVHDEVKSIAGRWKEQYYRDGSWMKIYFSSFTAKEIHDQLLSLLPNATPTQISTIIGNSSWTRLECDECYQEVDAVVCLGNNEDTVCVCLNCLLKAVDAQKDNLKDFE